LIVVVIQLPVSFIPLVALSIQIRKIIPVKNEIFKNT
jgi:hypothetical protein